MDIIGVEIGNSMIKTGYFSGGILKDVFCSPTKFYGKFSFPEEWKALKPRFTGIASVVPDTTAKIQETVISVFPRTTVIHVTPLNCGIALDIKNPESVGVDRVLNCLAALELFGPGNLVVDAGTAVTIDVLSDEGSFAGGVIIPGADLWAYALSSAAMIGSRNSAPANLPGKNTEEAISAGIKYGIPGAVEGILKKFLEKYPGSGIIMTGGGGNAVAGFIKYKCVIKQHLALEGIKYVIRQQGHKV